MITLLLPPPAFACFASYGLACHAAVHRSEASEGCHAEARWAKAGRYQACFASYGLACHAVVHRSEASAGCHAEARWAKAGRELRLGGPFCLAPREA
jgi:hypothetical protein